MQINVVTEFVILRGRMSLAESIETADEVRT